MSESLRYCENCRVNLIQRDPVNDNIQLTTKTCGHCWGKETARLMDKMFIGECPYCGIPVTSKNQLDCHTSLRH